MTRIYIHLQDNEDSVPCFTVESSYEDAILLYEILKELSHWDGWKIASVEIDNPQPDYSNLPENVINSEGLKRLLEIRKEKKSKMN